MKVFFNLNQGKNYNFQKPSKQTFRSNFRVYNVDNGRKMGTITSPFRKGVNWKEFADYGIKNFQDKEKVNIVQFASSDGSEAYTMIISLLENKCNYNVEKFFPILACDIDAEVIKAANSGLINLSQKNIELINKNINNFAEYFIPSDKNLNIVNDCILKAFPDDNIKTFKVANKLTKNVIFNQADMYDILFSLRDNSNTIILCRNVLGYFNDNIIRSTVHILSKKLKEGSLFVIGELETSNTLIESYLENKGFIKVMKDVYRKIAV